MKKLFVFFLIISLLTIVISASVSAETVSESDLATTITADGKSGIFLQVAMAAGVQDKLTAEGPHTVFLVNDPAVMVWFVEQGYTKLEDAVADTKVPGIFLSHIAEGKFMTSDLTDGAKIMTLSGNELVVKVDGSDIYINNAKVTTSDYVTTNGVIHVIDKVIDPTAVETAAPASESNPKTGDAGLLPYVLVGAAAVGGILIVRKKKINKVLLLDPQNCLFWWHGMKSCVTDFITFMGVM